MQTNIQTDRQQIRNKQTDWQTNISLQQRDNATNFKILCKHKQKNTQTDKEYHEHKERLKDKQTDQDTLPPKTHERTNRQTNRI